MVRIIDDTTTRAYRDWILALSKTVKTKELPLVEVDGELFMDIAVPNLDVLAMRQWHGVLCNIQTIVEFLGETRP